ncbi:MAG: murein hydrolase activator EnvC [Jatrophihabitantaceae bacterium]
MAPPDPYGAGHRGVDLTTTPEVAVLSAAAGRVYFAGTVAGRGVVVIEHSDGVRTEYEPLTSSVSTGELVAAGQPLGRLHGRHGTCPPDHCLHWGARRNGAYFDPLTLLAGLGPVRLLPWWRPPSAALRPRMRASVGLAQPLGRDVGVYLGGREARVPE